MPENNRSPFRKAAENIVGGRVFLAAPPPPPPRTTQRINKREFEYLRALAATGSQEAAEAAAARAGEQHPSTIPKRKHVRDAVEAIMDRYGLTLEKLLETMEDNLKATKTTVAYGEKISSPDYPTRHKVVMDALALRGVGPKEGEKSQPTIVIHITTDQKSVYERIRGGVPLPENVIEIEVTPETGTS